MIFTYTIIKHVYLTSLTDYMSCFVNTWPSRVPGTMFLHRFLGNGDLPPEWFLMQYNWLRKRKAALWD